MASAAIIAGTAVLVWAGAARAWARQRSSVPTLTPTSWETTSIAALSGGNSRATMRSLNALPYRATLAYPRPLIPRF